MLYWHWVYLRKIVNILTVTSILTLSLTNLNFKIEHANISKGKDSNFTYTSQLQITLYTCTGIGTHSRLVPDLSLLALTPLVLLKSLLLYQRSPPT